MRVLIRLMILVLVPLSSNLRSQDTKLGYEYIKLHGEKKGLAQHNYEPVMIDMEYPYFTGDSTSYEFLNSEISNYLFESHKTFDKLCGSFFRDHRRDSSDDRTSNWSVIKTIDVVYLSSNLVSLTSFYEKQEGLNIFLNS